LAGNEFGPRKYQKSRLYVKPFFPAKKLARKISRRKRLNFKILGVRLLDRWKPRLLLFLSENQHCPIFFQLSN